ncbi:putative ABC transport system permease protein [Enterobacter sp. BIGb0383]|uniref:ABC transporter permease n=1 Tax=unclassified Enterobacter TaxID=2608935 RepID=UPI000F4616AB|nr:MULTISPECIES: FtsX-like permease family protein [unclassified Enterobacter]ROP59496.1 putative ABC transport system permease protein [Enterobacter sp. BIGb0383]ROS09037.1 putative ABC transport system permease protein [Enterobacter sp. BIGb0359]
MERLIPEVIKRAWFNLERNSRRSILSIAIITVVVFALCCTGGFGLYTYRSLMKETAMSIGHITLSQPRYFGEEEDLPLSNGLSDYSQIGKALGGIEGVHAILPRIEFNGLISNGQKSTIYMGTGIDPQEFSIKGDFLALKSGNTLNPQSDRVAKEDEPEVMLGVNLAQNLKVTTGGVVTLLSTTADGVLNAVDFKVRGIFSTGVPDLDKRQLYISVASAQALLATHKVSTLSVYLFETQQTLAAQKQVDAKLKTLKLVEPVITTPWQKLAVFYDGVKNLYNRIFVIMGGVMALVVFAALFNSMTMSVTERTREIGTLAALGTYSIEIIRGFLLEALLIATCGAVIGGGLSAAMASLLTIVDIRMPPAPGRTSSYPLHIYLSWELFIGVAVAVAIICFVVAWFAARKGVKKPIIEALIYV